MWRFGFEVATVLYNALPSVDVEMLFVELWGMGFELLLSGSPEAELTSGLLPPALKLPKLTRDDELTGVTLPPALFNIAPAPLPPTPATLIPLLLVFTLRPPIPLPLDPANGGGS